MAGQISPYCSVQFLGSSSVELLADRPKETAKKERDLLHSCDMEREKRLEKLPIVSFSLN
jgi:hypothetical protein